MEKETVMAAAMRKNLLYVVVMKNNLPNNNSQNHKRKAAERLLEKGSLQRSPHSFLKQKVGLHMMAGRTE